MIILFILIIKKAQVVPTGIVRMIRKCGVSCLANGAIHASQRAFGIPLSEGNQNMVQQDYATCQFPLPHVLTPISAAACSNCDDDGHGC
jgi:hypothetical protein